jgi:hypothetical protein
MKKGKSCVLKGYKKFKSAYGTVDSKNLKSIYLNLQTWVEPKEDEGNWERIISSISRSIKILITDIIDKGIFNENIIVDLDLRASGITLKKRSFMNLEITLFLNKPLEFKSSEIKNSVKNIISCLESELIKKNKYFSFYLTKSNPKLKTELI